MTNEQAINIIESCDAIMWGRLTDDEEIALQMAIEALQRRLENVNALSCSEKPNNSDLISRHDALKVLMRKERDQYNDWKRSGDERSLCAKKAYSSSIFAIYDLPSAEVRTQMSSADCISRQDAIDAICEHGTDLERRGITVLAVANYKQATVDLLESLISAEPEIIRCKDCKDYQTDWKISHYPNRHFCATMDSTMPEDGFCSYAERKDNG